MSFVCHRVPAVTTATHPPHLLLQQNPEWSDILVPATLVLPCAGSWVVTIDPLHFRMSQKATKPGSVCLSVSIVFFIVLLFIRAPFYVSLVCLLIVLVKLSVLAK